MRRHTYASPSHAAPSTTLPRVPARAHTPSSDPTHLGAATDTVSVPVDFRRALVVSDPHHAAIRHAVREAYLRRHGNPAAHR